MEKSLMFQQVDIKKQKNQTDNTAVSTSGVS